MRCCARHSPGWLMLWGLAGTALLTAGSALAQTFGNMGSTGSFGSNSRGSSGFLGGGGLQGSSSLGRGGLGSSGLGSSGLGSGGLGTFGSGLTGGSGLGGLSGSTGSTGRGRTGGGLGSYGGVSSSNILSATYANPQAMGFGSGSSQSSFGRPLFGNLSTGSGMSGGIGNLGGLGRSGGMMGGMGGLGGMSGARGTGMGTGNISGPLYTARPEPSRLPLPTGLVVRADLQQVLANSGLERLPSLNKVQVLMGNNKVILRGKVASTQERRLTEAMLRLSPGVHDVSNELEVAP